MTNLSYMPLSGVEDNRAGVAYALLTEVNGSWQTEFFRQYDALGWGNGQADIYFGQCRKTLQPGERFTTCAAYFTCCAGTLDDCCRKLSRMQEQAFPAPAAYDCKHYSKKTRVNKSLCSNRSSAVEKPSRLKSSMT